MDEQMGSAEVKIAIVGTGDGCEGAPFTDPSWLLWGLNDGYVTWPSAAKPARWFELHGDTELTRSRRSPEHWNRLALLNCPVYTLFKLPTVPTAMRFPLEKALSHGRDYFACTCAYQIALAVAEGATEIGLFGTPFIGTREALVERPCVEWWIGFAEGKGIRVSVYHPCSYGLMRQQYRYAFEDRLERSNTLRFVEHYSDRSHSWISQERIRLGLMSVEEV